MTDAASPRVNLDVENTSKIGSFLWIGFYSTLLLIPTLTLFRFWARTIVRRRLWGETTIGGEPLEYTGRGLELFIGFLIAIFTVVLPVAGAILAAQFLLAPQFAVLLIFAIYIVLFVLIGVALFLTRRYQLSRTVWRGVRFEQRGSALGYGLSMFGYYLLTIITLGWFAPAMMLRLEDKLWSQAYFGDMPFSYDNSPAARTEPVYVSYILAYLGFAGFYVAMGALTVHLGIVDRPDMVGPQEIGLLYLALFVGGVIVALFMAWHQAALVRQITKSISIGPVRLRSRMSAWDMAELAITNTLLIIFTLGFGLLAAQMRVWRRVCKRLEVEGELELAHIQQAASRGPRSGEGMADAFDLSGGI